jgi:hypothetical protein
MGRRSDYSASTRMPIERAKCLKMMGITEDDYQKSLDGRFPFLFVFLQNCVYPISESNIGLTIFPMRNVIFLHDFIFSRFFGLRTYSTRGLSCEISRMFQFLWLPIFRVIFWSIWLSITEMLEIFHIVYHLSLTAFVRL